EAGTALMQRLITIRERFYSNLIGLHVEAGDWLTDERLRSLTGAVSANSAGTGEARARAAALLGGQVRLPASTPASIDAFTLIGWVCVGMIALIAFLKPMEIFFDSSSPAPPGG